MSASTSAPARGAAFWVCYAVTVISAVVSVTFAIIAVTEGGVDGDNANALYAASRSTALVVLVLVSPLFRSDAALLALAVAMTIVQGIDAFVGSIQGDLARTIWSVVLCLVTIIAATFLARSDRLRSAD
jgi:hypothetical protein